MMISRPAMLAVVLAAGACDRVFLDEPPSADGCSGPGLLNDSFDGALGPLWLVEERPGGVNKVVQTPTALTFDLSVAGELTGIYTERTVRFSEGSFSVAIDVDAPPTASVVVSLDLVPLYYSGGPLTERGLMMRIFPVPGGGSNLELFRYVDDDPVMLRSLPYDPSAHRVWRIGRRGDDAVFETANTHDGEFTELTRFPLPYSLDYVRPRVLANNQNGVPFRVTVDEFNGGGPPDVGVCPATRLVDEFTANNPVVQRPWEVAILNGCSWDAVDGLKPEFVLNASNSSCRLLAGGLYSIVDSKLVIELESGPVATGNAVISSAIILQFLGSVLVTRTRQTTNPVGALELLTGSDELNAVSLFTTSYDDIAHRYWRFTTDDAPVASEVDLIFETSPDGRGWVEQFRTRQFSRREIEHTQVRLGVVHNEQTLSQPTVIFHGINAP